MSELFTQQTGLFTQQLEPCTQQFEQFTPDTFVANSVVPGISAAKTVANIGREVRAISPRLHMVEDAKAYRLVTEFRQRQYSQLYPDVKIAKLDPFDQQAIIFYSTNGQGEISGTARLVFDGNLGLPDESTLKPWVVKMRQQSCSMVELGRFIISEQNSDVLKQYYRVFYRLTLDHGIDNIVMLMRQKEVNFHVKRAGAILLQFDTGVTFGSQHHFAAVNWKLKNTPKRFLNWLGLPASFAAKTQTTTEKTETEEKDHV